MRCPRWCCGDKSWPLVKASSWEPNRHPFTKSFISSLIRPHRRGGAGFGGRSSESGGREGKQLGRVCAGHPGESGTKPGGDRGPPEVRPPAPRSGDLILLSHRVGGGCHGRVGSPQGTRGPSCERPSPRGNRQRLNAQEPEARTAFQHRPCGGLRTGRAEGPWHGEPPPRPHLRPTSVPGMQSPWVGAPSGGSLRKEQRLARAPSP